MSRDSTTDPATTDGASSSVLLPTPSGEPPALIKLVDHTKPSQDDLASPPGEATDDAPPPGEQVTRSSTHQSLREQLAHRKYRRYQEDRLQGKAGTHSRGASKQIAEEENDIDSSHHDSEDSRWGQSRLDRSRNKARGVIGRIEPPKYKKPKHQPPSAEGTIDTLYENQRGAFLCGIPRFSSRSLFQFDPSAWVDTFFKPSAVDIHNAQVPDPSWQWDWRTWYVDMSRDVDEEGWEYSFWFQGGASWHGTHPWFHSFVRRRRWIRKRVRSEKVQRKKEADGDAHALNADYFTIHSRTRVGAESDDERSLKVKSLDNDDEGVKRSSTWGAKSWREQEDDGEIGDMPTLLKGLRRATIDREKINLLQRFLDEGGEELHYLAKELPHIMSMLVFQTSRRQLLSLLMDKYESVPEGQEGEGEDEPERDERIQGKQNRIEDEATSSSKDTTPDPTSTPRSRLLSNLKDALKVADDHCKGLEYWSDIRDAVIQGDTLTGTDEDANWGKEWQGVDQSGPDPTAVEHHGNEDGEDALNIDSDSREAESPEDIFSTPLAEPRKSLGDGNRKGKEKVRDNEDEKGDD